MPLHTSFLDGGKVIPVDAGHQSHLTLQEAALEISKVISLLLIFQTVPEPQHDCNSDYNHVPWKVSPDWIAY